MGDDAPFSQKNFFSKIYSTQIRLKEAEEEELWARAKDKATEAVNSSSVADAATGVAVVDGERIGEKLEKVASDAFAKKIISIAYFIVQKMSFSCQEAGRRRRSLPNRRRRLAHSDNHHIEVNLRR